MPLPFIKFYPSDWEADAQLMLCSLSARAVWLHMIRVMHEADPYGFFLGRGGQTVDLTAFARRVAAAKREVTKALSELESREVYSRDPDGRIYCRRMVREYAISLDAAENGKAGGSPLLLGVNLEDKPKPDKVSVKAWDKLARAITRFPDSQSNSDSLRSSAVSVGTWPGKIDKLRELALVFIAEFANCRDATKAEKYIGQYTGVLAAVRGRGLTIEQAWQACVDAREACGGRPLFGGSIRTAISFLPPSRNGNRASNAQRDNDRGADMDNQIQEARRRQGATQ
jgi:hypothetical protein